MVLDIDTMDSKLQDYFGVSRTLPFDSGPVLLTIPLIALLGERLQLHYHHTYGHMEHTSLPDPSRSGDAPSSLGLPRICECRPGPSSYRVQQSLAINRVFFRACASTQVYRVHCLLLLNSHLDVRDHYCSGVRSGTFLRHKRVQASG